MRKLALLAALVCGAAVPAGADTPAAEGARIIVPAHDIARGEVIEGSDLVYQTVTGAHSLGGIATSMGDLEGREARRMLRAGELVRSDDVRRPILVQKGATVTMTFEAPGITVTAVGRAVSEAGLGESVIVLNPVSYRQITATVTGAGQVRAGDAGMIVAAAAKP